MPPSLLTNEMEELPTRESPTSTDELVAANARILQMLQDMAAKQDELVRNQEKQYRRMDDLEALYARDIQDGSEGLVSTSLVAGEEGAEHLDAPCAQDTRALDANGSVLASMMQEQMRMHQEQMKAMMQMVTKGNQRLPTHNVADIKGLAKVKTFTNKEDEYDEWRRKTFNFLGEATTLKKSIQDIDDVHGMQNGDKNRMFEKPVS